MGCKEALCSGVWGSPSLLGGVLELSGRWPLWPVAEGQACASSAVLLVKLLTAGRASTGGHGDMALGLMDPNTASAHGCGSCGSRRRSQKHWPANKNPCRDNKTDIFTPHCPPTPLRIQRIRVIFRELADNGSREVESACPLSATSASPGLPRSRDALPPAPDL